MPQGDPGSIRCAYSPWRLQHPPTPLLNARALLQPSTAEAQGGPMPSKRGAARASSPQRSLCLHCPAGLRSWDPPPDPGTTPPSRPTPRSAPPPRDRPPPPQPACQPAARRVRARPAARRPAQPGPHAPAAPQPAGRLPAAPGPGAAPFRLAPPAGRASVTAREAAWLGGGLRGPGGLGTARGLEPRGLCSSECGARPGSGLRGPRLCLGRRETRLAFCRVGRLQAGGHKGTIYSPRNEAGRSLAAVAGHRRGTEAWPRAGGGRGGTGPRRGQPLAGTRPRPRDPERDTTRTRTAPRHRRGEPWVPGLTRPAPLLPLQHLECSARGALFLTFSPLTVEGRRCLAAAPAPPH